MRPRTSETGQNNSNKALLAALLAMRYVAAHSEILASWRSHKRNVSWFMRVLRRCIRAATSSINEGRASTLGLWARTWLNVPFVLLVVLVLDALVWAALLALWTAVFSRPPQWLSLIVLTAGFVSGATSAWPWSDSFEHRPMLGPSALCLGLASLLVYPLAISFFYITLLLGALGFYLATRSLPADESPPLRYLGGALAAFAVSYAFAIAATQPLALERTVFARTVTVPDPLRPGHTMSFARGGLLGVDGNHLVVVICTATGTPAATALGIHAPSGYSLGGGIVRADPASVIVTAGNYRFNGATRLSLGGLISSALAPDPPPPRAELCE